MQKLADITQPRIIWIEMAGKIESDHIDHIRYRSNTGQIDHIRTVHMAAY